MKIGIITFHRPINYGAVLQTVALSRKINDMGGEAEIIDYRNELQERSIQNLNFKTAKGAKSKIKSLLFSKVNNKKVIKFQEFLKMNSNLSKKTYDKNNISETNNIYDLFITGSDQVWNLNLTNKDYNYFLKFVDNDQKKVSYASSFGYSNIPEEYKEGSKNYLNKYTKISVREKQGQVIVKDVVGKDATTVLDPTLLLNKSEWVKLAKEPSFKVPEKFILLYAVSPTDEDFKIAKQLSKKMKMKVILINYNMKYVFGMKNCFDLGPEEFLWLFNKATFVITNSFHGTAFSLNFNKNFFVRLSTKKNNGNSRIENIINIMNLQNRYIDVNNLDNNNSNIDWDCVNKRLEGERQNSINIISDYLKMGEI